VDDIPAAQPHAADAPPAKPHAESAEITGWGTKRLIERLESRNLANADRDAAFAALDPIIGRVVMLRGTPPCNPPLERSEHENARYAIENIHSEMAKLISRRESGTRLRAAYMMLALGVDDIDPSDKDAQQAVGMVVHALNETNPAELQLLVSLALRSPKAGNYAPAGSLVLALAKDRTDWERSNEFKKHCESVDSAHIMRADHTLVDGDVSGANQIADRMCFHSDPLVRRAGVYIQYAYDPHLEADPYHRGIIEAVLKKETDASVRDVISPPVTWPVDCPPERHWWKPPPDAAAAKKLP